MENFIGSIFFIFIFDVNDALVCVLAQVTLLQSTSTFRSYLTVLKSIDSLNICFEVDHHEMVLAFQNVRFALLVYILFRFVVETVQGSVGSKDPHVAAAWLSDVKNSEKVLFFCFFHYCV